MPLLLLLLPIFRLLFPLALPDSLCLAYFGTSFCIRREARFAFTGTPQDISSDSY